MNAPFAAHVAAFALAALLCFACAVPARGVDEPDTRRGLTAFVLSSGLWAAANAGYLLAPGAELKYALYVAGLIVGFWTVFPWLYFCSAYAGRAFHRAPALRRASLGLVVAVTAVKVTNPLHGQYFEAAMVTDPFVHLAVQHAPLHWVAMGLAYVLSVLGFFLLFEVFAQVGQSVRPLAGLTALFGAPVALDLLGATTDLVLEMTYEPLGVAAFAVGVTVVYHERFRTVQLAAERDHPVLVLTDDGRVRDYNSRLADAFPAFGDRGTIGTPLADVAPALAATLEDDAELVEATDGEGRCYQVTTTRPGTSQLGRVVTLVDVTERERYRRRLERQNERLERFASVVSHDLRNPLTVAKGRLQLAREEGDSESLATVGRSLDRMEGLIEDLLTLARQGRDIDETVVVSLADVADRAWTQVESDAATLDVVDDAAFEADPDRLQQLLENLFRNSLEHAGPDVVVRVGSLAAEPGFYVADDGPGIPAEKREQVFESGVSTSDSGTGFGLAIVAEIARAHGWAVRVTESESGGARFEVDGVTPG